MKPTAHVDATLWAFLCEDILRAMAERKLPSPPQLPRFARDTARPGRPS